MTWITVIWSQNERNLELSINYSTENSKKIIKKSATIFNDDIIFDDTNGHFFIGGSKNILGFDGIISTFAYDRISEKKPANFKLSLIEDFERKVLEKYELIQEKRREKNRLVLFHTLRIKLDNILCPLIISTFSRGQKRCAYNEKSASLGKKCLFWEEENFTS